MTNTNIVIQALKSLITGNQEKNQLLLTIDNYFSPSYIQTVNGKKLSFDELKKHLVTLNNVIQCCELNIIDTAEQDNKVFINHEVFIIKNDGSKSHTKVIAQFILSDNKIISCDELTHLLSGNQDDEKLGYISE